MPKTLKTIQMMEFYIEIELIYVIINFIDCFKPYYDITVVS